MKLNRYIDHTLLRPDATRADIRKLCEEAVECDFAAVCVNSCRVPYAAELLRGSGVAVCCVVGFPLGAMLTCAKAYEAGAAAEKGADEVDMVMNIGAAKDGDWAFVEADIRAVAGACHPKALLKVIIETCLLNDDEKKAACRCAVRAGADYVKTSTGFSAGGAVPADVALMREAVGPKVGVKAAGGIHTHEEAQAMIRAGATRLGTSSGVRLMGE